MKKKYNLRYIILSLLFILFILLLINSLNVKYKELFENMGDDYPPIFVISLQKRQERREHIKNEFENNNIKNWQFFDAYEPTDEEMKKYPNRRKGKVGVTMSHRLVWEKCLELNKPVFIFEDDVYFNNFTYDDIKLLNNNKDKWDIAWFGHCYEKKDENIIGNFCKSYRPRCRHSYIITPEGAKILLDNIDFKSNGDEQMGILIKDNKIKSLSLFPATVDQSWQKMNYEVFKSDTNTKKFTKNMNYNIYILWTGDNELTKNRLNSIEQLKNVTECNIILITKDNLSEYILSEHPLHPAYKYLSAVHRSDYLRTYLMHFYGEGYSDIKKTKGSWRKSFDSLYNSDKWIIGYPEIRGGTASTVPYNSYNELIGNCCYICKKNTPFTTEWYNSLINKLNNKLSELKIYPAKTLRDANTENNKYPIKWTEILGDIYHPLILKYNYKVMRTLPMCINVNYK